MSGSWVIEHSCPQCGAPVMLEETDRILSCRYCRVSLYLTTSDCFRYCLMPAAGTADTHFFAPYQRFRGMEFSCGDGGLRCRVIDTSMNATAHAFLPDSLGLRPQAMKLRFAESCPGLRLLRPTMQCAKSFSKKSDPLPAGDASEWFREYIGETLSLMYAPFFIKDRSLYDGILNRPVPDALPEEDGALAFETLAGGQLSCIPTLCPYCGWQMTGARESCVMLCLNCDSAWQPAGSRFEKIDSGRAAAPAAADLYIPFWEMKATVAGMTIASYADLVRLANLPRAPQPHWEDQRLLFWSPAFKIQPGLFLRLARQMTLLQPAEPAEAGFRGCPLYPVTLPAAEAAEAIRVILAQVAKNRQRVYPLLADAAVRLEAYRLVYFPFKQNGNELIECARGFSIDRNALQFGAGI